MEKIINEFTDENKQDAYLLHAFSIKDKIRRFIWQIVWLVICRLTPPPFHVWRIFVLRLFGAKIGINCAVYPDCKIWAPWLLEMEDVATIGPRVEIYNPGGIFIGHHAILSQGAYLCGATHDYNTIEFAYIKKRIVIMPYVWICARAIVLPGVICNVGSVLAAGSITSKDLGEWQVYGGNPAKKITERNDFLNDQNTIL